MSLSRFEMTPATAFVEAGFKIYSVVRESGNLRTLPA
jgi:hypothetical protein